MFREIPPPQTERRPSRRQATGRGDARSAGRGRPPDPGGTGGPRAGGEGGGRELRGSSGLWGQYFMCSQVEDYPGVFGERTGTPGGWALAHL